MESKLSAPRLLAQKPLRTFAGGDFECQRTHLAGTTVGANGREGREYRGQYQGREWGRREEGTEGCSEEQRNRSLASPSRRAHAAAAGRTTRRGCNPRGVLWRGL
jgi:hypothetical protein